MRVRTTGEMRDCGAHVRALGYEEVRLAEIRSTEPHFAEVRPAEVRRAEVRPAEGRVAEVRKDFGCLRVIAALEFFQHHLA